MFCFVAVVDDDVGEGQKVDKVPVIRIYGSALSGQKTCMHLHRVLLTRLRFWRFFSEIGIFLEEENGILIWFPFWALQALPYLYVPCSDANPQSLDECKCMLVNYC